MKSQTKYFSLGFALKNFFTLLNNNWSPNKNLYYLIFIRYMFNATDIELIFNHDIGFTILWHFVRGQDSYLEGFFVMFFFLFFFLCIVLLFLFEYFDIPVLKFPHFAFILHRTFTGIILLIQILSLSHHHH